MGRWLLLSSSLLVLGALTALGPVSRDPDAHALGGGCQATRECREGLSCVDRDGVIEGQCSATCSESSSCQAEFGAAALCLGADLCARSCARASDCPSGTDCNVYGWCERARR
jgi:hypothetical protein